MTAFRPDPLLFDPLLEFYDTGQSAEEHASTGLKLVVLQHQIHRTDTEPDGAVENVMSTLKAFQLVVGIFDEAALVPTTCADGLQLSATLVYENGGGHAVEELSATLEPCLLGGETIVTDGIASFKLRITVLSSLCRGNRFQVKIDCAERPELSVTTGPMRTITKLKRPPYKPVAAKAAAALADAAPLYTGFKRELDMTLLEEQEIECDAEPPRSIDSLWEEVHSNASRLLELQKQQQVLFDELREIQKQKA